ncbi:MAG: abhydrolase domain-containing 18 [Acidobacteriota bacterium]
MHKWERWLVDRTTNRVVRPFEWGIEFLNASQTDANSNERETLFQFNQRAVAESDRFFGLNGPTDFSCDGQWLTFTSPLETPYAQNNTAYARYFPAPRRDGDSDEASRARRRAVLVLPQWNGQSDSHIALCRLLNRFQIAALRLSLPYHDRRMPQEMERADYMVSANLGRTLQAVRQAVLDTRAAIDWLTGQGYDRIGITGTSIGSCVSFLAFTHDARLKTAVFNLVSSYFGDVVWDGMATEHIRRSLESEVTREELRRAWMAISPNAYVRRLAGDRRRGLMISARYDRTFTPELSRLLFEECSRHRVGFDRKMLPWGHYTMGEAPFKYYDGYLIVNYLRKHL